VKSVEAGIFGTETGVSCAVALLWWDPPRVVAV
jgi:hypothetical protein